MKNLIHVLLAILPAAVFADEWVESGRPPGQPPAAIVITNPPAAVVVTNQISVTVTNIQVGGGAADNLGDHTATGALNMASFGISNAGPVSITGGGMSGGYTLRAIYGGPGAFDMIQMAGGSPYDEVGLWPWGAMDGNVLAYSSLYDAWVPSAGGGGSGDNLGNHTATNTLDMGTNVVNLTAPSGMMPWQLGAFLESPGGIYPMPQFSGYYSGSPYTVGLLPWGATDGDVLAYDQAANAWKPTAASGGGAGGNTLFGADASDPNNGEDVFIRAGSVRDPFTLMGQPGTTYIQGATNGVTSKHGGIVIATVGSTTPDSMSGGDITIQSGAGGNMGGTNGAIRIIPGFSGSVNLTPRLLMGNKDSGHYIEFDGDKFILSSSSCTIRFVPSVGPGTGWMEITQGSITKLTFTNDTILIDGAEVYTGTPGAGQVPVFTKGFCTGVTTP